MASARARAREAEEDVARADRDADAERARLVDLRRYLGQGLDRARAERDSIGAETAHLDSLEGVLRGLDGELQAMRDEAKRRVAARCAAILRLIDLQQAWVGAMRHFYVEGPNLPRASMAPVGYPSPDSLTRAERGLLDDLRRLVERMRDGAPDLLDRSYQHAWRPNVIERAGTNRLEAHRLLTWAAQLSPVIAAAVDAAGGSPELLALQAGAARRVARRDSLVSEARAQSRSVARAAVERARAALENEREGIDYGLAVAAYGASVKLTAAAVDSVARDSTAAPDSAGARAASEETDDPETAAWRARAIASLRRFLDRHPASSARGEMRFRLADVLMVDARQSFRARMAEFLAKQEKGIPTGAPPVVDPAPALALYRAILKEDAGFPRRDAVLFNAAMLLADEGDSEAQTFFAQLVRDHPQSSYVQESYLRMGDLQFDQRQFTACVPLYQRAAAGDDPSLRAIALYKLGWSYFNAERLDDAADAFRAVLDVYQSRRDLRINVDIEGEAEAYLVHSLARAGGAAAFARHFETVGGRPYEQRVLRDLALHFRRYSMYGEAAQAQELALVRYPLDADALASAGRLPETYERWSHADLARQARLEYADRFVPGSAWYAAQRSDSVKAAGEAFARAAWLSVALDHHRAAREKGAREDWSEALRLYRKVLEHWPQDSLAASYQLVAGEASQHLGDYAGALEAYARAATGPDSVARQALFQRVAVTDAWYESRRGQATRGPDSLAHAVLAAGDTMLARYPDHDAAADVAWRLGNLAFAHGWYERAAQDFDRLTTRRPKDPRSPGAAVLRGDAYFRLGDFEKAGAAFEAAQRLAHDARRDSLEKRAAAAVPVCWFRAAEALAASDSTAHMEQAKRFQQVATRWPSYEHAPLAQYRAGLAWLDAGRTREGVEAMDALIRDFPKSEYVKDAHLQIARAWESHAHPVEAADAYLGFARAFPQDSSAAPAWLKAADLLSGAGQEARADDLRLSYGPDHPISTLLDPETPNVPAAKPGRHGHRAAARPALADTSRSRSFLAEYLRRGTAHSGLVSKQLLAQVRYLQGEEAGARYAAARLAQPLEKSIPIKQKLLDSTLARYRASIDLGAPEWSSASAYRIGEALVGFGEALEHSERPADLRGDDLRAYDDVILQQSQGFESRGEDVWSDLLRERGKDEKPNRWVTQARELIAGTAPALSREAPDSEAAQADSGKKGHVQAQREEGRP
ncbi:MAG: tetratricopeptide repeat protein [Candidatus Eisenbacteria bacterium]|uniref:Tetratricopeptide repeat protein n=1 Tax=Eiseniibacteriota bacterium TaxID=2212470 RepID=A0A538U2F4_UNCEI|nr:MAG: tetratricopeptide repeat protein [Candidatus Eisenbacteria bacterium]